MGLVAAFVSAFLHTAKDLVSKSLAADVDSIVSTFASFAFALPFYILLLAILLWTGHEELVFSSSFLSLVLLRAIFDCGAEWCKMQALSEADISLLSPFLALSPVFLLILSPLITGDVPSFRGGAGVVLVILGGLFLLSPSSMRGGSISKRAIVLATLTSVLFAMNACFDRLAVQEATPVWAGFMMTLTAGAFFVPSLLRNAARQSDLQMYSFAFSLRGIFELGYMVCKLYALQFMQAPYVDSIRKLSIVCLLYTSPSPRDPL